MSSSEPVAGTQSYGLLGGSLHLDELPVGAVRPVREDPDRGEADAFVDADRASVEGGDESVNSLGAKRSRPKSSPASTKLFPRPCPVQSGCSPSPISSLGRCGAL